jgi:hypothetical protein
MTYKKYLNSVLFSFLLGWLIFIIAALYQLGAPTESSRWIYEVDTIKTRIAHSIETPKFLIVGGSNALFGISSQMITQELGIPSVNTAINAGLGANYILHRAQSLTKSGDTVLLSLEYQLYLPDSQNSKVLIDYVLARDPNYVLAHPWLILFLSFERLKLGILAKLQTPPRTQGEYQSQTINASGDETNNREADMTEQQRQKLKKWTPIKIDNKLVPHSSEIKTIKSFINWCRQHNIKVFATWPNTIWFDRYQAPIYQEFFQDIEKFYQSLGVPVLGNYRDFMYDISLFYDTRYHLNDRGMRYRTNHLIDLLRSEKIRN